LTVDEFALFLVVFFIAFAFSTCSGGGSSKSYTEQYGYSAEDFYYKGSDGLWYAR